MRPLLFMLAAFVLFLARRTPDSGPDLIVYNGKIVTVDERFSIGQAMAVKDGRIEAVGSSADILKRKGPNTRLVDLHGRMVLPGLIDSHTHPSAASMVELDPAIPEMET